MLINKNEQFAFEFLGQHIEEGITQFGDGFCLLVLELTRRVCRRDPTQKSPRTQQMTQDGKMKPEWIILTWWGGLLHQ
jgi:hypothetical protein